MVIRKLAENDLKTLVPAFMNAFNTGDWGQRWTPETARASLDNLFSFPDFFGLTAEVDGVPVGAILGHVRSFNDGKTYFIDELFVDPAKQKQGIAGELYQTAIRMLRKDGVQGAFFTTLKNSAAYRFYTGQGALELTDSAVFYHPFGNAETSDEAEQ